MLINIVWLILLISSGCSGQEPSDSLEQVRDICNKKLELRSIGEFTLFVEHLKRLEPEKIALVGKDESLKKCLDDRQSFLALEELVRNYDRERPCKMSEVAKLEQFARTYLAGSYRPASVKFFTLFGVSVGLQCKVKLLAHVRQAEGEAEPLDFIYSMSSPAGWTVLANEQAKKTMKFGGSAHAANSVANRLARLVPGLDQVEQLEYLDFEQAGERLASGVEESTFALADAAASASLAASLAQISESCRSLESLYLNSLLSLARLNYLGLLVEVGELGRLHEGSLMLHRWLSAASFCQLMSRVSCEPSSEGIKLQLVHQSEQLEHRRRLYSYAAPMEEIQPLAAESAWLASVWEGRWRRREAAMFKSEGPSVAMQQLSQFIRGLERDYRSSLATKGAE